MDFKAFQFATASTDPPDYPEIRMRLPYFIALSLAALSPAANAQMLGQTMDAEWVYSSFGQTIENHTVLVGPGVELPSTTILNDSKFEIDIYDDTIEFRFNSASSWANTAFNGWLFRDTNGTLPAISGYAIDSFSAGVTNTGGITTGFNDDECWANFAGLSFAGGGDWIRMRVTFGNSPVLSVSNLTAGQVATITVDNLTNNGVVGIAYSLTGGGPSTANAGPCGPMAVDLSTPLNVLGVFTASGTSYSMNQSIPAGASGQAVWIQALDLVTCDLSNQLALSIL